MKQLYLIRHGAVRLPKGICYGQSDVPLDEKVSVLASALRPQLPNHYALYSSPLSRCRLLAEALKPPIEEARLMEMNFGQWEMCPYENIPREQMDAWAKNPLYFRPPSGETVAEMRARVEEVLQEILQNCNQNIVIVSHAGVLRAATGFLLGLPEKMWLQQSFAYGSVTPISLPTQAG